MVKLDDVTKAERWKRGRPRYPSREKAMKTRKQKTELPENIPIITPEMMAKTAIEIAKRSTGKKESPIKGVKNIECPSCGNRTMSYADELTFDVTLTEERMVIPNLTGLKCSKCGEVALDADSTKIIEKYIADKPGGDPQNMPADVMEWTESENDIPAQARKKRTLKDIIGLVKAREDAVESKKRVQKGLDKVPDIDRIH